MKRHVVRLVLLAALTLAAEAGFKKAERPFLWMDRQDVEAAKRRWSEPWAEKAFEASLTGCDTTTFRNLFRVQVLGNEDAAKAELAKLLGFIGDDITKSKPRSDNIEHVLRYDILYDRLTPEQRKAIEDTFREHIRWLLNDYWRGPSDDPNWKGENPRVEYTRTNWLPNMHYPRNQGIFLMALALQDEALIREVYACRVAGFQWFMGEYVADGRFYMEEFGKQYSTFGELLLWCRGCERLGLDELGFGHVGKNGDHSTLKHAHTVAHIILHLDFGNAGPLVQNTDPGRIAIRPVQSGPLGSEVECFRSICVQLEGRGVFPSGEP